MVEPTTSADQAYLGYYRIPSLAGVHGRLRLSGPRGSRLVDIDDCDVTVKVDTGETADCVLSCFEPDDLVRLIRGDINIVTAVLQGRARAEGDLTLALQIAGSMRELATYPFADAKKGGAS